MGVVLVQRTPYVTVTNREGRTFAVRYLPTGSLYGRRNAVGPADSPMVEFYDTTVADDTAGDYWQGPHGFGPMGQFVSRYYADTLLGRDRYGRGDTGEVGLDLYGGVPEWQLDAATMRTVLAWLERIHV